MTIIKYRGKNLYLENTPIEKIARKNPTPFYLYSLNQLEKNFSYFKNTFYKTNPLICFAVKSNPNLNVVAPIANATPVNATIDKSKIVMVRRARD